MANTDALKTTVEPYVRSWLQARFGQPFHSKFLSLVGCTGMHEFDAVSQDGKIVGAIKCSTGKTSGGNLPSGKFAGLFQELYFLASVEAETRLIVLTNREFFNLSKRKTEGKLARNIQIVHCPLSAELEDLAAGVCRNASDEIDRGKARSMGRAAGT